ncbi:hypothetical protein AOLE_07600 [Acinetobacter oleivorans DR1]|uniref:Uncharacterized protein n=1 Tax=Acinetobacter oleivorans (strain JCM 16667 / KCTC 23045 / DR1) TaxID=436717 RepID=A0AAN0P7Q8_ACISD|nr:hypothetical protein AOLE_07600 [Acinetobacter oleivorans DR1]
MIGINNCQNIIFKDTDLIENDKIPLTPAQQKVLNVQIPKSLDFRYEREIIIKNLSKAIQGFVK